MRTTPLRVALVAGTLGQGGAERQLVLMARALTAAGVTARVYGLTQGEFFTDALQRAGVPYEWVGRWASPPFRLANLAARLRPFRPHVVQATHFFTNLYACLTARAFGAVGIGSIRNDLTYEFRTEGRWARALLRCPRSLVTNSWRAKGKAETLGVPGQTVYVLPNVIDLVEFDRHSAESQSGAAGSGLRVVIVARLVAAKRIDRFLQAMALARRGVPGLDGWVVGDGPERARLEALARELDLSPAVQFLGRRDDVPALLRQAHVFMLTSEHEGFPNVLLEAMAARLPAITTPAGDADRIVEDGVTGFVVPMDRPGDLADRLVRLATDPEERRRLGEAGRRRVERDYAAEGLAGRLLDLYGSIARQQANRLLPIRSPGLRAL